MKTQLLILGAGISLLGILAGCGGPERRVLRGGTSHLPLLDGREMRYEEHSNGETIPFTLRMRYAGGKHVRIFEVEFDGLDRGFCSFISQDSSVVFSTDMPTAPLEPLPEYRELWVDENLAEDSSWTEMDVGVETLFAGYEAVTVPAGTFPECFKTVTTVLPIYGDTLTALRERGEITTELFQRESALVGTYTVRWFAAGVGLVKEQLSTGIERVLLEIEEEGKGEWQAAPDSVTIIETGQTE